MNRYGDFSFRVDEGLRCEKPMLFRAYFLILQGRISGELTETGLANE